MFLSEGLFQISKVRVLHTSAPHCFNISRERLLSKCIWGLRSGWRFQKHQGDWCAHISLTGAIAMRFHSEVWALSTEWKGNQFLIPLSNSGPLMLHVKSCQSSALHKDLVTSKLEKSAKKSKDREMRGMESLLCQGRERLWLTKRGSGKH